MIIKMFYCMTQHFDNVKGYVASAHPFYHPNEMKTSLCNNFTIFDGHDVSMFSIIPVNGVG